MKLRTKQVITVGVGILVAVGMLLLGLWQMSRFQFSVADVAAERAQQPPVSLAESVAQDGTIDDIYGRTVTLQGRFLPDYAVLVGTQWPMRSVMAYEMSDGRVVAVVLGTVEPTTPPPDVPEEMSLSGVFLAGDAGSQDTVAPDAPEGSLPTVRLQSLVQHWPQPMIAGYVTVPAETSAEFGLSGAETVLPETDGTAMHQGYALQWWVFAAAAVAFSIFVAKGFEQDERKRLARVDGPR
ncbi:SURF1 family protein [Tessaracoccus sp. OS52]|uniref:SURF1 family protein n=1 Tax=Tessaracoccus sp. OS52 TaxID=2886691 RepID=UPI001D10178D|nr:SURF1 family protein [Tessaracoccus sp. OS52]